MCTAAANTQAAETSALRGQTVQGVEFLGVRCGRYLRRGASGAAGQQAPHQQGGVVHVQRVHPLPRPARQTANPHDAMPVKPGAQARHI